MPGGPEGSLRDSRAGGRTGLEGPDGHGLLPGSENVSLRVAVLPLLMELSFPSRLASALSNPA